jgi:hypothetical protein
MELIFRISLFIAAVINILPSILTFLPNKISKSYGIELPNVNYQLLLRHRAAMFGIIGGFMLSSAITKSYYELSTLLGLMSMVSFILLYFLIGKEINAELKKVMQIDVIATIILIIGLTLYLFSLKNITAIQ